MRVNPAILGSTLLICVATHVAVAQPISQDTAQRPSPSAETLKVYTRETIVDITVTDAKGNPVHGLTRDDFMVKEDGKPQSIRGFHEYGAAPVAAPPKLPPHVYTNLRPPPSSAAVNIFLLDFMNLAAMPGVSILGSEDAQARAFAAQKAIREAAKKYAATMPVGTQVIVLGLAKNLRTLQGLTSDASLISASLDGFKYADQGRVGTYEQYCAEAEVRTRMTIEAMNQIAADASTLKGKKNLLWFSVGIPWLTDPNAHARCLPDYYSDLLKTYGLFSAAQIAVDPIDVRGVPTMPNAFITSMGVLWENIPALPGPAWMAANAAFMQDTAERELAMEAIAEATGGTAFYNSNDLAASISKAVDKGSAYYSVTYSPPGQKYNWAHHTIKVSLADTAPGGLHLLYRRSYDAVDPATIKPAPGLTLALAPDTSGPPDMRVQMTRAMPTSAGLLFDVRVEQATEPAEAGAPAVVGMLVPKFQGKPLTRYTFQYAIPGRQIGILEGHGGLEFDLAAYDPEGSLVTSLRQAIKLNLPPDKVGELAVTALPYTQQLDLPSGEIVLRVGVLDRTSNKLGTLEIPLSVPKR